jgi:hypothetical protein
MFITALHRLLKTKDSIFAINYLIIIRFDIEFEARLISNKDWRCESMKFMKDWF